MPVKVVYPLIRLGGILYGKFNLNADSPLEAVRRAKVPILLIHGAEDRYVPCQMSREICCAGGDNARLEIFPEATHGISYVTDPERYKRVVENFLKECTANWEKRK